MEKNKFGFQVKMYHESNPPPYENIWSWAITDARGRDIMPVVAYSSKAGCRRMASKIAKSLGVTLQHEGSN